MHVCVSVCVCVYVSVCVYMYMLRPVHGVHRLCIFAKPMSLTCTKSCLNIALTDVTPRVRSPVYYYSITGSSRQTTGRQGVYNAVFD